MLKIAADIETAHQQITCIGFAWSKNDAICIPFFSMQTGESYWTEEEELAIVEKIRELFSVSEIKIAGQNWHYDSQYIARQWGIMVYPSWLDTMLAQHVCFPGLQKSLDFISSMYCEYYSFWKDDGKEARKEFNDEQHWVYNCDDCCYTYEDALALELLLARLDKRDPYERMMRKWIPLLKMMLRGTRVDMQRKAQLINELSRARKDIMDWITEILGHEINPNSPAQMVKLFYQDFKMKTAKNKAGNASCDKKALATIATREPLLKPLIDAIELYRTLGIFLNTFVTAPLDWDQRIRSMYGLAGTETYRLNSKADAFGFGTNLQNIPSNKDE